MLYYVIQRDNCPRHEASPGPDRVRQDITTEVHRNPAIKNDLVLEVTDSTQCQEYATSSHLWSDCYGNADYNKLYRRQMEYPINYPKKLRHIETVIGGVHP